MVDSHYLIRNRWEKTNVCCDLTFPRLNPMAKIFAVPYASSVNMPSQHAVAIALQMIFVPMDNAKYSVSTP